MPSSPLGAAFEIFCRNPLRWLEILGFGKAAKRCARGRYPLLTYPNG